MRTDIYRLTLASAFIERCNKIPELLKGEFRLDLAVAKEKEMDNKSLGAIELAGEVLTALEKMDNPNTPLDVFGKTAIFHLKVWLGKQ